MFSKDPENILDLLLLFDLSHLERFHLKLHFEIYLFAQTVDFNTMILY